MFSLIGSLSNPALTKFFEMLIAPPPYWEFCPMTTLPTHLNAIFHFILPSPLYLILFTNDTYFANILPFYTIFAYLRSLQILLRIICKHTTHVTHSRGFCSAWSRSQVQNQSFGPKQNNKLTVDPLHHPPTENFFQGSRLLLRPLRISVSVSQSQSFVIRTLIKRLTQAKHSKT